MIADSNQTCRFADDWFRRKTGKTPQARRGFRFVSFHSHNTPARRWRRDYECLIWVDGDWRSEVTQSDLVSLVDGYNAGSTNIDRLTYWHVTHVILILLIFSFLFKNSSNSSPWQWVAGQTRVSRRLIAIVCGVQQRSEVRNVPLWPQRLHKFYIKEKNRLAAHVWEELGVVHPSLWWIKSHEYPTSKYWMLTHNSNWSKKEACRSHVREIMWRMAQRILSSSSSSAVSVF